MDIRRQSIRTVLAALVLSLLIVPCAWASSSPAWPMIGFDSAHTGRSPYAGPTAVAGWKWSFTPTRFFFDSSPAIGADGTIYAYDRERLCAFRPDGTLRWTCEPGELGVAASPALANDGTIYLATGNGTLYAIDGGGREKWEVAGVGYPMSPTVGDDGTVYFGTDLAVFGSDTNWDFEYAGYFYAVAPSGALKWAWKTGRIRSCPAIGIDGTVYLTCWDGNLYALDPATGTQKWAFNASGAYMGDITLTSPSVGDDGTIYFGSPNGDLYAVNPNGTQKWMVAVRQTGYTGNTAWGLSSPAIARDGTIYITLGVWDWVDNGPMRPVSGELHAFNPDGSRKWIYAIAGPTTRGFEPLCAPIVDNDGVVYVTVPYPGPDSGNEGGLYAINPDGSPKWSFTATSGPSGAAFTPLYPAIAEDGTLYVGSASKELYAFGGTILAPTVTGFTPTTGPAGTSVTLTGTNLDGATAVTFNGAAATFSAVSATEITATVPAGVSSGAIAVTTPDGTAVSTSSFTVTAPPMFTPTVTLELTGLSGGAIKLGKSVAAKGIVTPSSLVGSTVTLTVQKKKGNRWVKVASSLRTISSAGSYGWKHKPTRKGAYRAQATIAKTAVHTAAKTAWRSFVVR